MLWDPRAEKHQLGVDCVAPVPCTGHLDGVQGNDVLSLCRRRWQPAKGLGHQVQSRDSRLHQQEVSKPCLQLDPKAIVHEHTVLPCPFPSHWLQRRVVTAESCFCLPWEMETSIRFFFIRTISGWNFLLCVLQYNKLTGHFHTWRWW